jgi:hypothetical protein
MMHPSRLHDLCTFLKNDSALFKNPQQALALELISGKEPSLLVIGLTGIDCFHILCAHPFNNHSLQGSGKTLPIFMSIGMYDGGATTMLILPLVAMHDEYWFRAH